MLGESEDARTMTIHLQTIRLQPQSKPIPLVEPDLVPEVMPLPAPVILASQPLGDAVRPIFPTGNLAPSVNGELCITPAKPRTNEQVLQVEEAVLIGDPASDKKIQFAENWWYREPAGRWLSCCTAIFTVSLADDLPDGSVLRIFGGGETDVTIRLNNQPAFTASFRRDLPIAIPLQKGLSERALVVSLSVSDTGLQSPKSLGRGNDPRILSIFIDKIELAMGDNFAG